MPTRHRVPDHGRPQHSQSPTGGRSASARCSARFRRVTSRAGRRLDSHPAGTVQVDIIEVTDAELSRLPDDETDRLAVLSHAWAIDTATLVNIRATSRLAAADTGVVVLVAEPGP